MEHFLFRSVRRELSHRDLSGNFAELKHRWDSGNRFVIESVGTDFQGALIFAADLEQRQQFIDDVIGRDQRRRVAVEPPLGGRVIGIGGDEPGELAPVSTKMPLIGCRGCGS